MARFCAVKPSCSKAWNIFKLIVLCFTLNMPILSTYLRAVYVKKESDDQKRDQMLREVDYQIWPYTQIPSISQLQMDIRD